MSELNPELTTSSLTDTNAEYILPAEEKKQPPVFKSVAKAIIVETVKDFFGSIIGFFFRYIRHLFQCFIYFFSPSLKKHPFNKLNYKEHAQHSFELLIILMALVIFMEKLEWIPQTSSDMLTLYSNDLVQKFAEVYFFIIFALVYLIAAGLSILLGRLFRKLFSIPVTKDEADILLNYMNNSTFCIATVFAFVLRCVASTNTHDEESLNDFMFTYLGTGIVILVAVWSIRFAILHKFSFGKGCAFAITSFIVFSLLFFMSCITVTGGLLVI